MARSGRGALDGGRIADLPIEAQISGMLVCALGPHRWLAGLKRLPGVDDGRQRLVIDRDPLGRVARGGQGLGDDHRHGVADMAHPVQGDRRPGRRRHR